MGSSAEYNSFIKKGWHNVLIQTVHREVRLSRSNFRLMKTIVYMDNCDLVTVRFEYEGTMCLAGKQKFYNDAAYIHSYKDVKSIVSKDALLDYVKSFAPE